MKTLLKDGGGIPNTLLYTLAIIAGISVANLYYNQPLLEMLRQDLHASTMEANHIALYTQIGYALGLLFIIPLADLFSRKRIILANFSILVVSLLAIATAGSIYTVHVFSLLTGICSVVPQIFIPIAAQFSTPATKGRNVGLVISGLLTGILASRVVSGLVADFRPWRNRHLRHHQRRGTSQSRGRRFNGRLPGVSFAPLTSPFPGLSAAALAPNAPLSEVSRPGYSSRSSV